MYILLCVGFPLSKLYISLTLLGVLNDKLLDYYYNFNMDYIFYNQWVYVVLLILHSCFVQCLSFHDHIHSWYL